MAGVLSYPILRAADKDKGEVRTTSAWPSYGNDPGGMRFSPTTQITPVNVSELKVAWVYHMRPPSNFRHQAMG